MSFTTKQKEKLKEKYKRCKICKSNEELQFHHLIPGLEILSNALPLCKICHKKLHDKYEEYVNDKCGKLLEKQRNDHLREKKKYMGQFKRTNNENILFNKFADLQKELRQRQINFEKEILD